MNVRISARLVTVAYLLALACVTVEWPLKLRAQATAKPSTARTLRLPEVPYKYLDIDLPPHFTRDAARRFDNTPPSNAVTDEGATLGRVLFYDTRLSGNNTIACGSCHVQKHAFADPNR